MLKGVIKESSQSAQFKPFGAENGDNQNLKILSVLREGNGVHKQGARIRLGLFFGLIQNRDYTLECGLFFGFAKR